MTRKTTILENINELLTYDSTTGEISWKVSRRGHIRAGKIAGHVAHPPHSRTSYRCIKIDGKTYYAHRLAWMFVFRRWPRAFLDHINGNGLDNRISNLREATSAQNNRNTPRRCDNTSGYKGVCYHISNKRYTAGIRINGVGKHLGSFATAKEAHAAYCTAAKENFGEFARVK